MFNVIQLFVVFVNPMANSKLDPRALYLTVTRSTREMEVKEHFSVQFPSQNNPSSAKICSKICQINRLNFFPLYPNNHTTTIVAFIFVLIEFAVLFVV